MEVPLWALPRVAVLAASLAEDADKLPPPQPCDKVLTAMSTLSSTIVAGLSFARESLLTGDIAFGVVAPPIDEWARLRERLSSGTRGAVDRRCRRSRSNAIDCSLSKRIRAVASRTLPSRRNLSDGVESMASHIACTEAAATDVDRSARGKGLGMRARQW